MGTKVLPLCTVKLLSTKCGNTTDRRDQTFNLGLSDLLVLREFARREVDTSENGIFQVDLDI